MFFVYILKSPNTGKYYIGCTNNIENRLNKHNKGIVRSTKAYKPWKIVYKEKFNTLSKARKRENQIKSWKSKKSVERLIKKFGAIV